MAGTLWKLDDVRLEGGSRDRLAAVTLEIEEGTTAIVGYSGAGKTSLLNLLVGFERPDGGALASCVGMHASTDRTTDEAHRFALPVYWVPQAGGLWPHLTAVEHLEAVTPDGEPRERLAALLAAFDIADRAEARPDELSQGEAARLSVARALAADAAVLVMDEPFSNVDPARTGRYWDEVRARVAATGASLVFATHSPRDVLREAERVVCLKEGRVIASGDVREVYSRPATREVALCLGEANWLEPGEARTWLGREETAPRCFRPEEIAVERAEEGPFVVRRSRFQGSLAEVELVREDTGEETRLLHRPSSDGLAAGVRVSVKVVLSLIVAALALVAGCREDGGPTLAVREWRVWPMPPDGTKLPAPRAVAAMPDGGFIVLDTAARVLLFDAKGGLARSWRMPETEAGNPEGACWLEAPFFGRGRIAIADTHYHRVIFFDEGGNEAGRLGRLGRGPGEFIYPVAMDRDAAGDLYVCEYGSNDRVQKFAPGGKLTATFGSFGTGPGQFQRPSGIVWHEGKVYVADAINGRIQAFTDDGRFVGVLPLDRGVPLGRGAATEGGRLELDLPYEIALGPDGMLYVAEYGAGRVSKVGPGGELLGRYGRPGTGRGEFRTPWGLAVDAAMRILVADTKNRRLVMLTQEGAR